METTVVHTCSKCGERAAVCTWGGDTDGVSWSTEVWYHECRACAHKERHECYVQYNCEHYDKCAICGESVR
jgi:hypothetical protein